MMSTADPSLRSSSATDGAIVQRLRDLSLWSTSRAAAGMQRMFGNRRADGFGILMYHRVCAAAAGLPKPTWHVTPGVLRRQLSGLLARGFEPWPLGRLIEARRNLQVVPSRAFAVTFDDGYRNNLTQALPILRELRVPATIFLATRFLDSREPFPFDDWSGKGSSRAPRDAWQPLTSDECRELSRSGLIELGAHTHNHECFVGRPDQFRRDLATCLAVLHDRFDVERPTFAFPYGACDAQMLETARELGATCALTTEHRRVECTDDEFGWSRFNVWSGDSDAVLAAKLSGWYATVAAARNTVVSPYKIKRQTVRRSPAPAASHSSTAHGYEPAEAASRS